MSGNGRSRRAHGDGGYRRRGDSSFELKFPVTDPKTGMRVMRYHTFRGNETGARAKLRELVKNAHDGFAPIQPRQTFGEVLDAWEKTLAVKALSPKTLERYRDVARVHVRPRLGTTKLTNLRTSTLETFYGDLLAGRGPTGKRLAAATVKYAHIVVDQALELAQRDGLVPANPARRAKRPKLQRDEIEILSEDEVRHILRKLHGRPMYRLAALGLSTGMRRGELLALRWKDVDLEAGSLRVEQSLEQTKTGAGDGARPILGAGLRFKAPKTRHGRRSISLPASIIAELRALRKEQAEERLKLGLGREPDDALVFRTSEGAPLLPNSVTTEWRRLVTALKLPRVSMHAWRHTHASQLIDSGMDVLTISRRLGHGSPSITLDVYGHRFKRKDDTAAAVFDNAFAKVLSE